MKRHAPLILSLALTICIPLLAVVVVYSMVFDKPLISFGPSAEQRLHTIGGTLPNFNGHKVGGKIIDGECSEVRNESNMPALTYIEKMDKDTYDQEIIKFKRELSRQGIQWDDQSETLSGAIFQREGKRYKISPASYYHSAGAVPSGYGIKLTACDY